METTPGDKSPRHRIHPPAPLWERRKLRCSSHIKAKASRLPPLPQEQKHGPPVGAPEGAMLFAHRSQKHRGCRRSHKSSARRPCGSAGRRDALATPKPKHRGFRRSHKSRSAAPCGSAGRRDAFRPSKPKHRGCRRSHKSRSTAPCGSAGRRDALATSKPKHRGFRRSHKSKSAAPLWERRKARCSSHIEANSIVAAAAPTKSVRGAPVGAPEGAMLFLLQARAVPLRNRGSGSTSRCAARPA
jgi:hypothetical protein